MPTAAGPTPSLDENRVAFILDAFQGHALSAHAVAWRVTRDHHLAADAVQEAFLCLWRQHDSYEPERGKVGPFLHTIVYRRAVDLVRRNGRTPQSFALHLLDERVLCPLDGPEDQACLSDVGDRVRKAIGELSVDKRKPLVLAYYLGMTYPQVATALGVPLGTVKTRIAAARRDLRTALSGSLDPAGIAGIAGIAEIG